MLDSIISHELFWTVFDVLINFLQGTLWTWFSFSCVKLRKFKNLKVIPYSVTTFITSLTITICNHIAEFEGPAIFIYAMELWLSMILFSEGTLSKKLFISVAAVNAMSVCSIFTLNLISYIVQRPIVDFMTSDIMLCFISILASNLVLFMILFAIKKIMMIQSLRLKETEWMLLSFDLVISVVAYMFIYYSIQSSDSLVSNFYCALCAAAIVIVNITMYFLLAKFSNRYEIETENILLRQQTEYQEEAIVETKKQYDELQKVRHDFDNIISVIRTLNIEGKNAEIEEYINEHLNTKLASKMLIKTGNSFVDAVINSKLSEAQQKGIKASISTVSDLESDHNIDLCSLIGNLLDNAVRAAKDSAKKLIKVDIRRDGKSIVITVKNTVNDSVLSKNPDLISDKSDKKMHGYGTRIIRDIANKHSGFADFYEEDGYFCCNVILYL